MISCHDIGEKTGNLRVAPGGIGDAGRRCLPPDGDQRGDVLHLEEEVCGTRRHGATRTEATQRREFEAPALVADLTLDKHILSEVVRKKV